ncbi:uncharacterized protein LOC120749893 isoform X1 [Hirundo rustica]|uniref:uncharacterized protein LOC120749893 isoform X1 n=1 Tax=Hirundo rustica TaxID=43150 RepID=UPI0026728B99|nr:uncharacterized protein LOC120749893 isoform X1 [Hirundo rustica]
MAEPGERRGPAGDSGGGCAGLGESSEAETKTRSLLRWKEAEPVVLGKENERWEPFKREAPKRIGVSDFKSLTQIPLWIVMAPIFTGWSPWPGVSNPAENALDRDVISILSWSSTGALPLPRGAASASLSPQIPRMEDKGDNRNVEVPYTGGLWCFGLHFGFMLKGGVWRGVSLSPVHYCTRCSCCSHRSSVLSLTLNDCI